MIAVDILFAFDEICLVCELGSLRDAKVLRTPLFTPELMKALLHHLHGVLCGKKLTLGMDSFQIQCLCTPATEM